jgi:hypothetical protein
MKAIEKTLAMDMQTQVAGWKAGLAEGQEKGRVGGGFSKDELGSLAQQRCPESATQKRVDWILGFCRGFREGVRRVEG